MSVEQKLDRIIELLERDSQESQRRHDRADRLKVAELGKLDSILAELSLTEWEPSTRER